MEQFKISNFEKANSGKRFPCFATFKGVNAEKLKLQFLKKINSNEVNKTLLEYFSEIESIAHDINAEDDSFDLESVVQKVGIKPFEKIYINWSRFEEIDQMSFIDLYIYFDDIWYPSVDDIEVFDDSFSWLLFITHYGVVKYVRL